MNIQALAFDGFDELDLVGVFEPLRMAGLEVQIVSLYQQNSITSAHGMQVIPQAKLDIENKPDWLIVPGGGWVARTAAGAWAEADKGFILEELKKFHEAGVKFAAVCTGVMLLAKAGLLSSRNATTNHAAVDELKEFGVKYINARVVDDGDLITAAGVTSSLDLGLWLVEKFCDRAMAKEVSARLEHQLRGPVWSPSESSLSQR